MKKLALIALCVALTINCSRLANAEEHGQPGSAEDSQVSSSPSHTSDDLHFVTVLIFRGEVVTADQVSRLLTLKAPGGDEVTLETRSEKELEGLKAGDHVAVRYFDGAQISRENPKKAVTASSLEDGVLRASTHRAGKGKDVLATVAAVDSVNQEVTLKGTDGSLETILVTNPDYFAKIKVGD